MNTRKNMSEKALKITQMSLSKILNDMWLNDKKHLFKPPMELIHIITEGIRINNKPLVIQEMYQILERYHDECILRNSFFGAMGTCSMGGE
nr:MAG TPA: hypothetical protein [Caudoviricetes sp.]